MTCFDNVLFSHIFWIIFLITYSRIFYFKIKDTYKLFKLDSDRRIRGLQHKEKIGTYQKLIKMKNEKLSKFTISVLCPTSSKRRLRQRINRNRIEH